MKSHHLFYIVSGLTILTGCQQHCNEDVICETYVHRYGVPLDPEDWSERGQYGQVISTRKDGVVVCKNYEGGVLNGEVTYTFPHREIIAKKEMFFEGNLCQELYYYPNGMPQKQISYEEPGIEKVVTWYESGAPQIKETYSNGFLIEGEYLNPSHQQESYVTNQNGIRTVRNEYGELVSVDEIQNGQMVLRRTYHSNGMPAAITPYVNGCIEGKRWTYHKGGEPATIEEWSNNLQHGNTEVFENGEKVADRPYQYGQIDGIERCYKDKYVLTHENKWVQGQLHGPSCSYINGTTQTTWYFKNRKVNRGTYDALCSQAGISGI